MRPITSIDANGGYILIVNISHIYGDVRVDGAIKEHQSKGSPMKSTHQVENRVISDRA